MIVTEPQTSSEIHAEQLAAGTPHRSRSAPSLMRRGLPKWLCNSILIALTVYTSARILEHPLATNDGPVHVAFSHLILTYNQPGNPLQHQAYTLNLGLNPNLVVYFLMAALMRFLSPALAESIIQVLCIAGPIAAAYFALRTIHPRNTWLAIFLLPLTLNQMFFLGLYNHSLSIAAFFLVLGLFVWMNKSPSYPRAAAVAAALVLAFFCHASGFLMAFAGIAIISATTALRSCLRLHQATPSWWTAILVSLKNQRFTLAALLAPFPVGAVFVTSGGKSITEFGIPVYYRLDQFFKLHLLAVNYPYRDRFPAFAMSALLLTAFALVSFRVIRSHAEWPHQRRDLATGTVLATVAAVVIMTIFPDTLGGGWTHYRRFQVFPYFWVLLTLAFEEFAFGLTAIYFAVGAAASALLIHSTHARQETIRRQMDPLAQVDSLIGSHCTVLPLVLESHLVDHRKIPDWMDYQPYFQSASQLELHGDRVVLFNYLARLAPYPIHFRPEVEPQTNLFRWKPQQIDNAIARIDIPGFESTSGLKVDYILLWGTSNRRSPDMQRQIQTALTHFRPTYQSDDAWVTLYQRQSGANSLCTLPPSGAAAPGPRIAAPHPQTTTPAGTP